MSTKKVFLIKTYLQRKKLKFILFIYPHTTHKTCVQLIFFLSDY